MIRRILNQGSHDDPRHRLYFHHIPISSHSSLTISISTNSSNNQLINQQTIKNKMTNYKISLALVAMTTLTTDAFTVGPLHSTTSRAPTSIASTMNAEEFYFMEEKPAPVVPVAPKKKAVAKKASHGKDGLFSPVVKTAKTVLGEDKLNKIRGKAIGMHSEVIGNFVNTAETPFGQTVLKQLFAAADADRNGTLEENELENFLMTLGFSHLNAKQIHGIFERADADKNGHIDMEEWTKEAPKTLRTNLIKLAKKNGGELGFLA
jgi:hypothetical protein